MGDSGHAGHAEASKSDDPRGGTAVRETLQEVTNALHKSVVDYFDVMLRTLAAARGVSVEHLIASSPTIGLDAESTDVTPKREADHPYAQAWAELQDF